MSKKNKEENNSISNNPVTKRGFLQYLLGEKSNTGTGPIRRTQVAYGTPEYEKAYKEGRVATKFDPSTQTYDLMDLPEFTVTGKDERVKESMSKAGGEFWNTVGGLMSHPQRLATQAVTGTYQDPAEAMGIKNPIAAFFVNAVADPLNLVGVGLADDLMKITAKQLTKKGAKKTGKFSNIAEKTGDAIESSLKTVDDPEKIKKIAETQKQKVIDRYSSPEGKKRLQEWIDSNFERKPFGKSQSAFSKDYENDFRNILDIFTGFKGQKITPDDIISELKEMKIDPTDKNLYAQMRFNPFESENKLILGKGFTEKDLPIVSEHEVGHFLQRGTITEMDDALSKIDLKKSLSDKLNLPKTKTGTSKSVGFTNPEIAADYWKRGSLGKEKVAMLSELREDMLQKNIIKDPYEKITPEIIEKHIKEYEGSDDFILRLYEIMENTPKNKKIIIESLNKLPQVALPLAGGAAAIKENYSNNSPIEKINSISENSFIKKPSFKDLF
jgi:hypothetical protein